MSTGKASAKRRPKASPPAVAPSEPKAMDIEIQKDRGESDGQALARKVMQPSILSAVTLNAYRPEGVPMIPLQDLVNEVRAQGRLTNEGNLERPVATLTAQAHVLDSIFNKLAARASINIGHYPEAVERYLKLALRAQSQCRATLETLAAIKNPPVVFAKQANIAHGHQQVNNGVPASHAAEAENAPNKLLEEDHGQRVDAGAARAAGSVNPAMATVGAVNGAAKRRGQSQG